MSEASFASLGPTLLARKGGAKPAMRPQLAPLPETIADEALEDLGWNDMGSEDEQRSTGGTDHSNNVVALTPDCAPDEALEDASPLVKRQQKDLADRVLAEAAKPKGKAAKAGRRAAFTLRLDAERHLKLRLAATMEGKSAQVLVTEALDALLDQIDDLDSLAKRMKRT
ncbi:hypothetical protein [Erythrobacter sp. JK5]|uniref:hypothetical protein n=1 Tax=Erythrobacter sp. JK5 TaxID=2829500 RepID=UPI001BA863A5|nr:hypothetical protein [Erythrobacter sp. JK5]QUL36672.1 hypothetical protein KDC96_09540 [Erythrobacter sp. JK5]